MGEGCKVYDIKSEIEEVTLGLAETSLLTFALVIDDGFHSK
jgi:hypothetical protein